MLIATSLPVVVLLKKDWNHPAGALVMVSSSAICTVATLSEQAFVTVIAPVATVLVVEPPMELVPSNGFAVSTFEYAVMRAMITSRLPLFPPRLMVAVSAAVLVAMRQ